MNPLQVVTARSSLPEGFWALVKCITCVDEALLFPGDPNLRITIELFDPEDGDSGRIREVPPMTCTHPRIHLDSIDPWPGETL